MERDLDFVNNRVRLRHNDKVVGYLRKSGNSKFYSKDGFWWRGIEIPHIQQDACTGYKDKNNRWLHEHDLIELTRTGGEVINFRIVLIGSNWKLEELGSKKSIEIEILGSAATTRFVSYDFLNTKMFYDPPLN